jgi:hypothetical protein
MDEVDGRLPAQDIDNRLVSGWSALEQGDIDEARAALRDVYEVHPTHPGLTLLAAGIRRARPKPVRWRAAILAVVALVVVAGGAYTLLRRSPQVPPAQPVPKTASVPDVSRDATTTSGHVEAPAPVQAPERSAALEPRRASNDAPLDDDALVRQAIERFVTAYRSRWVPLAFQGCDLARQPATATAICHPRSTGSAQDAGAGGVWTFRLEKSASAWKILSVQPSPE